MIDNNAIMFREKAEHNRKKIPLIRKGINFYNNKIVVLNLEIIDNKKKLESMNKITDNLRKLYDNKMNKVRDIYWDIESDKHAEAWLKIKKIINREAKNLNITTVLLQ